MPLVPLATGTCTAATHVKCCNIHGTTCIRPAICGLQVSLLPALALSVMEGKNAPPDIAVLALDVDELESFQEQRGIESWIDYEKAAGQKFTAKYDK